METSGSSKLKGMKEVLFLILIALVANNANAGKYVVTFNV